MTTVLLVAYLLIVLAMIAVILLQRSEGGALGIGGGSTGLMTVRGSANLLTRTTAILAALFFATAIGLTVLSEIDRGTRGILQQAADGIGEDVEAPTTVLDALNQLQRQTDTSLPLPQTAPTTAAPPASVPAAGSDPALAVPQAATPNVTAPVAAPDAGAAAPAMAPAQPMTAPTTQAPAAPAQ